LYELDHKLQLVHHFFLSKNSKMKTTFLLTFIGLISNSFFSQINLSSADYWVGSGPDSALLVIDFIDASADPCYSFGYLFDASMNLPAADMLAAISDSEPVLDIAMGSGFLTDINYNSHSGIVGAPNFWQTWSYADDWSINSGLSEVLSNGSIFGCSYSDLDPAIAPSAPISAYSSTWFDTSDIIFWVGDGENEAVLLLDFIDDWNYGIPVRYAWGYRFNGTSNAQEMLEAINTADENLEINLDGGFLNDIEYIDHVGLAGAPHYWGTFSGTNLTNWTLNTGISEELIDGSWFGCTYDVWEPPRPFIPLPAVNGQSYTFSDIETWLGIGLDSCAVVIDFNDGLDNESISFGFLFSGQTTGNEALIAFEDAFEDADVNIGSGFLNDIIYSDHEGLAGNPNYWATWSGENIGGWYLNTGLDEVILNGQWFGCSYTNFDPATPPGIPTNVILSLSEYADSNFDIYPNPFQTDIRVSTDIESLNLIEVFDNYGKIVMTIDRSNINKLIDLSTLESGSYVLRLQTDSYITSKKIVKL
jgi:hypothetical protein